MSENWDLFFFTIFISAVLSDCGSLRPFAPLRIYNYDNAAKPLGLKLEGCQFNPRPGTIVEVPLSKKPNPSLLLDIVKQAAHCSWLVSFTNSEL